MTTPKILGRSEELAAAARPTPADLEADRVFWAYWGSSLFKAMLNAKAEPANEEGD